MSPEQFENTASCDVRSDIYAFGVVLFQMASGGELPSAQSDDGNALREVAKFFHPELLNRINEQIILKSLSQVDVLRILAPMLAEIQANLEKQYQVKLEIDEDAKAFIAQEGYDPKYGVREVRRIVEKLVQMPLSELILAGRLEKNSKWKLTRSGDRLEFGER